MDETLVVTPDAPTEAYAYDIGSPDALSPIVSTNIASDRAFKASTGLPGFKSYDELFTGILAGQENQLRSMAASHADGQKELIRQKALTNLVLTKGSNLSPDEQERFNTLVQAKIKTDPRSVFEENFAAEVFGRLRKTGNETDSDWADVKPDEAERAIAAGQEYHTKYDTFTTILQKYQSKAEQQSWPGFIFDKAVENLIPIAYQSMMRGNVKGVSWIAGGTLGENLQRQANQLWNLPFSEAKDQFEAAMAGMAKTDPSAAVAWGSSILGQASDEKFMNNVFSVIDVPLKTAIGASIGIVRRVRGTNAAEDAVKTVLQRQMKEPSTTAGISDAVGDTQKAAVQSVTNKILQDAEGSSNPASDALKGLEGLFVGKADKLRENPGNFSRELANRLADEYTALRGEVINVVKNKIQVDRTPALTALDSVMTKVAEEIKYDFPGVANRVLETKLRRDVTGQLYADIYLGDEGAVLFRTKTARDGFQRSFNLRDAIIGEREGLVKPIAGKVSLPSNPVPEEFRNIKLKTSSGITDTTGLWFLDGNKKIYSQSDKEGAVATLGKRAEELSKYAHITDKNSEGNRITVWYKPGEKDRAQKEVDVFKRGSNYEQMSIEEQKQYHRDGGEVLEYPKEAVENYIKNRFGTKTAVQGPVQAQQGVGHFVVMTKPLDETKPYMRQAAMELDTNHTPQTVINAWIGKLRTPEDTLSKEQLKNRKSATYGVSNLYDVNMSTIKDIAELKAWTLTSPERKSKWNTWGEVLTETQGIRDPSTGKLRRYYDTLPELEQHYLNKVQRSPDEQEAAAYFAYKKLEELSEAFRNFEYYKVLHSEGHQEHTIRMIDRRADVEDKFKSNPVKDIVINGKIVGALPKDGEVVVVIQDRVGREGFTTTDKLRSPKVLQDIKEGKRQIIELADPESKPFQHLQDTAKPSHVKYAVVRTSQLTSKGLDWNLNKLNRPADYEYEHFISQAIIEHDPVSGFVRYGGDRKIAGFNIRGLAKEIAEHINIIREFLKAGHEDEALKYFKTISQNKAKPPMDFDTIRGWFQHSVSPEGTPVRALLNLDQPVAVVPKGKMLIEMDKSIKRRYGGQLRDDASERYSRYGRSERYDERDIFTLENRGTKSNPLYTASDVGFVNPIKSINRSLSRVINSGVMEDYKRFSVEHWIQESKDHLAASDSELANSPYTFFFHPKWIDGVDNEFKANMMNANYQIKQFLGIQNANDTFLHSVTQKLVDTLYEKAGPKYALVPYHLLPYVKNPFDVIRGLTFDAIEGLFAIPTFMVQMGGFATVLGVAGPRFAAPGMKAALLHQYSRVNSLPGTMEHFDRIASTRIIPGTAEFKPGDFKEIHGLLSNSGFLKVGPEHILRNILERDILGSRLDRVRAAGRLPFRLGEETVRAAAYYTAALEFKEKNPGVKIGNREAAIILDRADLLNTNMSRASASALNTGIASIPTQFLTYYMRLAELFWSKRLTGLEKARLFTTYGMLFGVPVSFGVTGLPVADYLRKNALENGYVAHEDPLMTALWEGLPSTLLHAATGVTYNVGERYAGGGNPLTDILRSDKPFLDIIRGAAFSKAANTIGDMDGFYAAMMSRFRGDDEAFPIKTQDFTAAFMELKGVSDAVKLAFALEYKRIYNKKGQYVSDVDTGNAILMFLSGLQPQAQSDMYTMAWTEAVEKEKFSIAIQRFTREYRRAVEAYGADNNTQGRDFMIRAFRWLDFGGVPYDKQSAAMSEAAKGYESLISQSQRNYYTRDVNAIRQKNAIEAYPKVLQQR